MSALPPNNRIDWSKQKGSSIVLRGKASRILARFSGKGGTLLDIGAGSGFFAEQASRLPGISVTAADTENFLSAAAQKAVERFTAFDAAGGWLVSDNSFDFVTAWNVIEHLENPYKFAREAKRVLRPGGILIVSIPNVFNLKNRLKFLFTGNMYRFTQNNDHKSVVTKDLIRKMFAGFKTIARGADSFEAPFIPPMIASRLRGLPSPILIGLTYYEVLKKY